jgi:hypothetical protein
MGGGEEGKSLKSEFASEHHVNQFLASFTSVWPSSFLSTTATIFFIPPFPSVSFLLCVVRLGLSRLSKIIGELFYLH